MDKYFCYFTGHLHMFFKVIVFFPKFYEIYLRMRSLQILAIIILLIIEIFYAILPCLLKGKGLFKKKKSDILNFDFLYYIIFLYNVYSQWSYRAYSAAHKVKIQGKIMSIGYFSLRKIMIYLQFFLRSLNKEKCQLLSYYTACISHSEMGFSKLENWYLLEIVNKEIYLTFQTLAFLEKYYILFFLQFIGTLLMLLILFLFLIMEYYHIQ